MLARRLRIEIAAALLLLGGVAWLAGVDTAPGLVLAAVASLLTLVAIGVVASFAVAGARSGLLEAPGARLAEYAATVWTFLVLVPFAAGRLRRDSGNTGAPAVLLVHGYVCNRGAFWRMFRVLAHAGFRVHTHDLEPVYASIDDYVAGLAVRIDEVLARTGFDRVAVVCHSMGGLAMRAYLNAHGASKVAVLITLGTPHHGTRLARYGRGPNARQMEPGSAWLQSLAEGEAGSHRVPVVSVYSEDDNVVVPQESARFPGAQNIAMSGLGHLSLLYSETVAAHVVRAVRAPRAAL